MNRSYYSDTIQNFLAMSPIEITGHLNNNAFTSEQPQKDAWLEEINILKKVLVEFTGRIYFEYSIPRMGQRIDVVLLIGSVIFILEFKIGEKDFSTHALDQVMDYALDLKNFHETSHDKLVAPILISTKASATLDLIDLTPHKDQVLYPVKTNPQILAETLKNIVQFSNDIAAIDPILWEGGKYKPTPTIIEAAKALYNGHNVADISRNDASAVNLTQTSNSIIEIINHSKNNSRKSICFVTGVPGAGKTLVGLNIANIHSDKDDELYSVFLSGNDPLVNILREALTRDKYQQDKAQKLKTRKGEIFSAIKAKIQNVHHFRDEYLKDNKAPIEHVALFDEAQRAWNLIQTFNFMHRKKRIQNFNQSEPEFLISCLDRHKDWAVVVCLVGGGQEINTGEAGISEWINSLEKKFKDWDIYISPKLVDSEYNAKNTLEILKSRKNVRYNEALHLAISMRSFRAEHVSLLVKQLLDNDIESARSTFAKLKAKKWLKEKARGSERYGIVVSSQAERLKPQSIFVKSPMNPIHWFLNDKNDVRSSYALEDVATEFHVQGLELDWVCITWDADFRYSPDGWKHFSFKGNRWLNIKKIDRQNYLKNAYRVLLTRARQGMIIVVPEGDVTDHSRLPGFYNSTYNYLRKIGFEEI